MFFTAGNKKPIFCCLLLLLILAAGDVSSQDDETPSPRGPLPEHVRVVAIFGHTATSSFDISAAKLFQFVDKGLISNETRLVITVIQLPNTENMLTITGFLCAELKTASNLVGFVVGGLSKAPWTYIIELSRAWGVPVIDVFSDPVLDVVRTSYLVSTSEPLPMLVKLHPSYSHVTAAIQDVVSAYKWRRLVFLYDTKLNLMTMQRLLAEATKFSTVRETFVLQVTERNLLDVVKVALNVQQWTTIVAAFDSVMTIKFLKMAMRCGTLSSGYTFILANLDAHLFSMEEFAHNWPNVTVFRAIIDTPKSRRWLASAQDFDSIQGGYQVLVSEEVLGVQDRISLPTNLEFDRELPIFLTSALVIDGLSLFRQAIKNTLTDFFKSTDVESADLLSCSVATTIMDGYGAILFDQMKNISFDGITGLILLNPKSMTREKVNIDVLALSSRGLIKIGDWRSAYENGVQPGEKATSVFLWRPLQQEDELLRMKVKPEDLSLLSRALMAASIKKRTITVTTLLEKPYVMRRQSKTSAIAGASRAVNFHDLEGFCIDLVEEVASIIGFNYRIRVVADGKYGKYDNVTGRWNGMIGELIDKEADIAAAPLTITYAREQAVDFTKPFLHLGISIVHVQPQAAPPSMFSFMTPLAFNVWLAISVSYVVVTAVFFCVGRCSPKEFDYDEAEPDEKHPYNWASTSWFVVGGFLGQDSDITPRAISARIVACVWYFFSLIIISSYTANLAAFLTIEQHISPFENVEEMARQTQVLYGTLKGGSTENFFKEAKIDTYQQMWSFMKDKDVFARTNDEGIARVVEERGLYAYLMESVSLEYVLQSPVMNVNCSLRQVGGLIDSKGYGIATQRQSPYRDLLSMAILQLQESDRLAMLYDKWWKSQHLTCPGDGTQGAKTLDIQNVFGIFVVLAFGFLTAVIMVTIEVLWYARFVANRKLRYAQKLYHYFEIAVNYWHSKKRPYEGRRKVDTSRLQVIMEEEIDEAEVVLGGNNSSSGGNPADDNDDDEEATFIGDERSQSPPAKFQRQRRATLPLPPLINHGQSDSVLMHPVDTVTQTDFYESY